MVKILNTKQIRALDEYTIQHEPVLSIELMERACRAFVTWFIQRVDTTKKVGIVCGTGNNGGDGLGVARLLLEWGYAVKVWIVRGLVPESEDFKINLDRLKSKVEILDILSETDKELFTDRHVIIDAIFGSGLSRPAEGIYAQAIRCINQTDALRIAIDIPSGLSADQASPGEKIRADYTVSFQLPKLSFLLPQSYAFTGEWTTVDIGLNKAFIKNAETKHYLITARDVSKIIRPRSKHDHKGVYGHALMVAGSFGKIGAAVLASRAVLRAGAGLLTTHVPQCGYDIVQTSLPEAMVSVDSHKHFFTNDIDLEKYSAIGIGPGLGQEPDTVIAFEAILKGSKKAIIIDADALNILSTHHHLLKLIPEGSILTPHPKEFERLVGAWADDFERLQKQSDLSSKLKSVVIVKGANTVISAPDGNIFFNSTGNPGMATGGSGDVLTGILTGLLSCGYSSTDSAVIGVYLHGLAGDLAKLERGMEGLIASDLIEFLPKAFLKVGHK